MARRQVEKGGINGFRQAALRMIDEERRGPARELRKVLEQPGVGVDDFLDRLHSEHRLSDEQLKRHVLVLSLERTALSRLQVEVRGHQAGRDRTLSEVVVR